MTMTLKTCRTCGLDVPTFFVGEQECFVPHAVHTDVVSYDCPSKYSNDLTLVEAPTPPE